MDYGTRHDMLSRLADAVASVKVPHPTRVGIDGPPASGKNDELEQPGWDVKRR